MLDCQWLQMLHACGLLRGSFRPSDDICRLRALFRERNTMIDQRSDWVRRIQKSLDQMNVCVHHAVSDITGVAGMAIIRAIDDTEIIAYIKTLQPCVDDNETAPPPASKSKARNIAKKGQEPMRQALYQLTGFDMIIINGIGVDTAAVVTSELGLDYSAFPDEGHFVSYLRLAPNLSISAGKKVPSKLKGTTTTRVATALRTEALSLRNSKTALGAFYRRISRRKGASVAVFATAPMIRTIV